MPKPPSRPPSVKKARTPPRRAGRRPGRPAEFGRASAVEAALNGFWKNGYAAMSTSALSEAMGIERSSFYNSFGDRAALFREVLRRYGEITPDRPLGQVQPGQPVTPVVTAVFRDICRVRAADPAGRGCLMVNSIVTLVGTHPELAPVITGAVRQQATILERLLKQAAAQGEIPLPANLPGAAYALTIFLIGLNVFTRVERREAALWAACRHELGRLGFKVDA